MYHVHYGYAANPATVVTNSIVILRGVDGCAEMVRTTATDGVVLKEKAYRLLSENDPVYDVAEVWSIKYGCLIAVCKLSDLLPS